ncbi:universal stress protein [Streptomyces nigra]|uniref:universal stress protein n=1 Tax=Streptomyces nigra TaxID=1827580 RepID=UPI0035D56BB6
MTHCVTVGMNGSPESDAAVRWAAREAELRGGACVDLVHVEEWLEHPPRHVSTTEERRAWAESILLDAAEEVRRTRPSLEVRTRRVRGFPSLALVDASGESDMLVIGSRGLGGAAGFFLGSTAAATISEARVPVILVRAQGQEAESPHHAAQGPVVVGVDIRQPCEPLLAFAAAEAAYRGCALLVVHTLSLPPILGYAPSLHPDLVQEMLTEATDALERETRAWRDTYPSVTIDARALLGHPALQVPRLAADAALVVVGRRVRDDKGGMHIGPVTHAVLHHVKSPVAVIAHQ